MSSLSARYPLLLGFTAIFCVIFGLLAWSLATEISGAVIARGTVKVENERQVVQHPDGGVVGEILARDGDRVAAGEVMVRLDGTFLRSEIAIIERQLVELFARRGRLRAERDDLDAPHFGDAPDFTLLSPTLVKEQMDGQDALFHARRAAVAQEERQLVEQQSQVARQIQGIEAQLQAMERQLELISRERDNVQSLFDQGLVQARRLLEIQREEARVQGEVGRLVAGIAEAETRISQLRIEETRRARLRREEAIAELRDLRYTEIELQERRISLAERILRLDIRAPVGGVVFGSRVFAVQSVVRAAEPMMYIVPGDQSLLVSARIDPVDVDQVYPGQSVSLMLTAFNRRTTPEVAGRVLRIAADTTQDQSTGANFFEAVIVPDEEDLDTFPELKLVPGMPVEAFLKTEERSPLSYLTQPLTTYLSRAFREN